MDDPFGLERFEEAQEASGTYRRALSELRAGDKRTHWMWFVFPQLAGLGLSPTSRKYALSSLDEARAYLSHPLLGARLRECFLAVLAIKDRSADQIFGGIDARKLHSSSTLFCRAAPEDPYSGRSSTSTSAGSPMGPRTGSSAWPPKRAAHGPGRLPAATPRPVPETAPPMDMSNPGRGQWTYAASGHIRAMSTARARERACPSRNPGQSSTSPTVAPAVPTQQLKPKAGPCTWQGPAVGWPGATRAGGN